MAKLIVAFRNFADALNMIKKETGTLCSVQKSIRNFWGKKRFNNTKENLNTVL